MDTGRRLFKSDEFLKLEIAEELGLMDRVIDGGWKALSAKDTGRIGGILAARKKHLGISGESRPQ